jgi:phosphate-selective porin
MEETSMQEASVKDAFKTLVVVRLNIDDAKTAAFEFKVKSVPWLVVVDPFRRDIAAQHVGFATADELLGLVARARAGWKPPQEGAAPQGPAVTWQYKRTGLSLEAADHDLVVDLWTHHLFQAIEMTDADVELDTHRARHDRVGVQATLLERLTVLAHFDFAQASPLLDAYADCQITRPINVRAGRFKVPMGTQFLPRRDFWDFVEPSGYVLSLLPRRDLGAMLHGGGGTAGVNMRYALGVFNGVPDGTTDDDGDRELAARFSLVPFPSDGFELILTYALTEGDSESSLSGFRVTPDSIVSVLAFGAAARLDGRRSRRSVEAELLWGPFALGAERLVQESDITDGVVGTDAYRMWAFAAWGAWIVTGQRKSREDWPSPIEGWGALEVAARWSRFRADNGLRAFALAGRFTDGAEQATVGVNWYLNRFLRLMIDVERTEFDDRIEPVAGAGTRSNTAVLAGVEVRF